jgi:tetratricopeptide (TPR) repeat protein
MVEVLLIDSETYDRLGRLILEGRFQGEEVYSMNILYPYFVALVYLLGKGSLWAVLGIQAVLDSLSCVIVYWLGTRLFDNRVAMLAGIAGAVYGPMVFYSGSLLTPTLITFLILVATAILVRYQDRVSGKSALLAGVVLGLSALGRGNSLLLVPFAVLVFHVVGFDRRRAVVHWLIFALGAAVPVGAVTIRNYLVEGHFVPVAANYAAFYIGHNPEANGLYTMPSFTESADFESEVWGTQQALSEELGRPITLAEGSRHLFSRGVRHLVEHPREEFRLTLVKLYYFWNRTESPTNLNYAFARDYSWTLRSLPLSFGIIAPLALVGMFLARKKWRKHLVLYLVIAVHLITAVVFYVSAEYRLAAVPFLILFGSHAVVATVQNVREFQKKGQARKELLITALLLVPFLFACNVRDRLLEAQSLKRVDYLNFGTLYQDRGDHERAREMLQKSLEIDPRYGPAYASLAELYDEMGDEMEAARMALMARRYRPPGETPDAEDEIADGVLKAAELYENGAYPAALIEFEKLRGMAERMGDPEIILSVRNNIGLCHYKLGDLDRAAAIFIEILEGNPGYVKAHNNLGTVRRVEGKLDEAIGHFQRALEIDPRNQVARRALARLQN